MCDSWRLEREGELDLAEIERIYRQLPRLDAVRLTGGEPTVRADLDAIVELARRHLRPLAIHVTTNGFATDRLVALCAERDRSTPLDLLVSIDGVGDKHDAIRGVGRAYERAFRTLELLAPRRKELRLRLAVNQTIVDEEGFEHHRLLGEQLARLQVPLQVVIAYKESATYNLEREREVAAGVEGYTTFGAFDPRALRSFLDEVEAGLAARNPLERLAKRYYLAGLRRRLFGEDGPPQPRCVALNAHLRIFPNGDVPTCQFNSKLAGNLRRQAFAELWHSARAGEQRAWVRRCAGCWAECEVLPSAVYTADLFLRRPDRRPPRGPARHGLLKPETAIA